MLTFRPGDLQVSPLHEKMTVRKSLSSGSFGHPENDSRELMQNDLKRPAPCVAVLIPVYNNAKTLGDVLEGVLTQVHSVLVVDDGSTDEIADVLGSFRESIQVCRYSRNQGKGAALSTGFRLLYEQGFTHAITLDADGQHFPSNLPAFLVATSRQPAALLVGQRDMRGAGAPFRSRFGLTCSNFALSLLAGLRIEDSQAGFRAYPLNETCALGLRGRRYDLEMEVLMKAGWNGLPVVPLRIDVTYTPREGRVSHFRPLRDFARIVWMVLRLLMEGRRH